MLIPRYKIFACCECISLVAPLFLHTAPHAALLCLHHGHGPPSCPPKHYRFTHRQRTRFATWLGRLGTRRRDGSIHCLSVLGLLLRLLLMQLLAWWLAGWCCCCCWQAIRLGQQQTPAGTHPCTIAHARGPSPLCLCMQFISRNGGRACFSALFPPHFMVGFLSTCS